jgi:hypothetical protein
MSLSLTISGIGFLVRHQIGNDNETLKLKIIFGLGAYNGDYSVSTAILILPVKIITAFTDCCVISMSPISGLSMVPDIPKY